MKPRINLLAVAIAIGLVIAALYFYQRRATEVDAPGDEVATPPVASAPAMEPEPAQQVPRPLEVEMPPLPPLDESDAAASEAAAGLIGADDVAAWLVPQGILRKIVVTVDNLPNDKLPMRVRAVQPVPGSFLVAGEEGGYLLDARNFERYEPFVALVQRVDLGALVDTYTRFYPLLQESYSEIAPPGRQFHGRLVEAIDDMLAAPEVPAPIELRRPRVFYEFADPSLERLSVGQKALIRAGPENAAIIKARLLELRQELASRSQAVDGGRP
jgi:hypothetical protein